MSGSSNKLPAPRVVAQNIIREHGKPGFQMLIDMLRAGESGTKIGYVFGVTRQRVCQWRAILGTETVHYEVHPTIVDLVDTTVSTYAKRHADDVEAPAEAETAPQPAVESTLAEEE